MNVSAPSYLYRHIYKIILHAYIGLMYRFLRKPVIQIP